MEDDPLKHVQVAQADNWVEPQIFRKTVDDLHMMERIKRNLKEELLKTSYTVGILMFRKIELCIHMSI